MNNVVLIGRITRDIEIRETASGVSVTNFTLAVDGYNDNTDFIDCVAWKTQAENMAKFLGKGSQVGVEGRIQVRKYEDKDGNSRKAVEVVCNRVQFLDSKRKEQPSDDRAVAEEDVPF